jgi:putative restriction endonuclease
LRIVRDTEIGREVKSLYDYSCQVCGKQLECPAGFYAEAAHIKGLGKPHNGPDTLDNLLCLCPNHHVLFDKGGFAIADNFDLVGIPGKLNVDKKHKINQEYIRYHKNHFFGGKMTFA